MTDSTELHAHIDSGAVSRIFDSLNHLFKQPILLLGLGIDMLPNIL